MLTFDLTAELRAALGDPGVRAALATALRPALEEAVRSELARREHDALLSAVEAARFLGLSPAAFKMRRRRSPALDALSVGAGRFRRWRRADLVELVRELGLARAAVQP